jgi:hypothetical protein
MGRQHSLDALAQLGIPLAGIFEINASLRLGIGFQRAEKDVFKS